MIDLVSALKHITDTLYTLISRSENLELSNSLIEVYTATIELQKQLIQLQSENEELKKKVVLLEDLWTQEQDIERYDQPYITFRSDSKNIKYCENCWNVDKKKVRFNLKYLTSYECPVCHTLAIFPDAEP